MIYVGITNNGDANSLQYIFDQKPTKTTNKSDPAIETLHFARKFGIFVLAQERNPEWKRIHSV